MRRWASGKSLASSSVVTGSKEEGVEFGGRDGMLNTLRIEYNVCSSQTLLIFLIITNTADC